MLPQWTFSYDINRQYTLLLIPLVTLHEQFEMKFADYEGMTIKQQ